MGIQGIKKVRCAGPHRSTLLPSSVLASNLSWSLLSGFWLQRAATIMMDGIDIEQDDKGAISYRCAAAF